MKDLLNAKMISAVGATGVIAFYLVYWLTTSAATAAQVTAVDTKLDAHGQRMEEQGRERTAQTEAQLRLLRLICISIAKNPSLAAECTR